MSKLLHQVYPTMTLMPRKDRVPAHYVISIRGKGFAAATTDKHRSLAQAKSAFATLLQGVPTSAFEPNQLVLDLETPRGCAVVTRLDTRPEQA